jgi:hypothetical protein
VLTFLVTDTPQVKGPYTLARLRELWNAREIVADSKLFLTERNDETNRVKCFNLRAADIKENLESGEEIDVGGLCARVTSRHGTEESNEVS